MVAITYTLIQLKLKINIPWCATVGKTFLKDSLVIVHKNYKMKDNYTAKYCTIMCSLAAKIF